jgi:hypothetical protein
VGVGAGAGNGDGDGDGGAGAATVLGALGRWCFWRGFGAGRAGRAGGASRAPALSGSDVSPTSGLARRLAAYATPTATTRPTSASATHPATARLPVVT